MPPGIETLIILFLKIPSSSVYKSNPHGPLPRPALARPQYAFARCPFGIVGRPKRDYSCPSSIHTVMTDNRSNETFRYYSMETDSALACTDNYYTIKN